MAEQYNMQTGFIDGSGVYGPNEVYIRKDKMGVLYNYLSSFVL